MPEKIEETPLRRISREVGDPGLFPPEVHRLFEAGNARKAQAALRAHFPKEPNSARQKRQRQYAEDPYLWLEPLVKAPSLHTVNGIGTTLYGHYKPGRDGIYIATLWFVFVFLPVFPIAAYVVRKGEGNLWHFFAKAPLPPFARIWRLGFVVVALAGIVVSAGLGAWTGHTARVSVYNGFDLPLAVTLGEDSLTVPAQALVEAGRYSRSTPLHITTTPEGWAVPIETLDADLGSLHDSRVLYNPAGRASLVKGWIAYGTLEPPEDELLGTPVLSGISSIDYVFTTPPQSKSVEVGDTITNSVLSNLEDQVPQALGAFFTQTTVGPEDGWRMNAAHLAVHPGDTATFAVASRIHAPGTPEMAAVGALARAGMPGDVDAHRLYQNTLTPDQKQAARDEYLALAEAHPDDPMYHYLAGRLVDDDGPAAEARFRRALALDPGYAWAHLGLGFQLALRGDLEPALAEYAAWAASSPAAAAEAMRSRVRLLQVQGSPGWRDQALALIEEVERTQGASYATVTLAACLRATSGAPELLAALIDLPTALAPAYPDEEARAGALESARLDLALATGDLAQVRTLIEAMDPEEDEIVFTRASLTLALTARDRAALGRILDEHLDAITSMGSWFVLEAAAAATALGHPSAPALVQPLGDTLTPADLRANAVLDPNADLSTPAALDALLAPVGLDARGHGYAAAAILLDLGGQGDAATLAHARQQARRLLLPDEWAG
jgi:tetratricopeptide (TPR) repeat protein